MGACGTGCGGGWGYRSGGGSWRLGLWPGARLPGDPGHRLGTHHGDPLLYRTLLSVLLPLLGGAFHVCLCGPIVAHSWTVHDIDLARLFFRKRGICVQVPMPANVSFEEASAAPTVMITVDLALRQAASLGQQGCAPKRVLLHAAAGGVGLSAVQVAHFLGGSILASAGSPAKRAVLRRMAVVDVVSSRQTDFAEAALLLGAPDVVLNTLTSPAMVAASLSALTLGGVFIELSKR